MTLFEAAPGTEGIRQRRALATIPWRLVVLVIFAAVFWDAGSLAVLGSTSAYGGVSYAFLREMPGGMSDYGLALGVILAATMYAYCKADASPNDTLLRVGLATLAGWYCGWTVAICYSWLIHWQAAGIGGLGRTVGFAGMCWLASYFAPRGG